MSDSSTASSPGAREPHSQLHPDALQKIVQIFGRDLAAVLRAHRRVEALTGETNVIGRQNLVEAFAHLSTLFARAPELDRDGQLAQVAYLADHLRRVMMESFEIEVYVGIASIWQDGGDQSVGRLYDAHAAPLLREGELLGHISPDEVEQRLDAIRDEVVTARGAKVADGDFGEWQGASELLENAAEKLRKLKREVGAAVDAAKIDVARIGGDRKAKRRWIISLGLAASATALNVLSRLAEWP